jgi:hypothetical protein
MLPFQPSTLTIFAVLITAPESLLPPVMTVALTVVCATCMVLVLVREFGRGDRERNESRKARARPDAM